MLKILNRASAWLPAAFGAFGVVVVLGMTPTSSHATIVLSPDGACSIASNPSQPQDDVFLSEKCGVTGLTLQYKSNVDGGDEEGPFSASYMTTYFNTPTDPQEALIGWITGTAAIDCPTCWLVVKDGNALPQFYGFNLGSWDGMESISLTNFWPSQGAISHVSIWTGDGGGGDDDEIPEPASLALVGLGLAGLALARRRGRKQ